MAEIGFFQLNDGESANVRILSTTVDKIERKFTHTVDIDGKKKKFACLSSNCSFCAHDNEAYERLVVHLWDYTDDKEKIWNRTTNKSFMDQLKDIETSWGSISDCVVKISRVGADFPKYTVTALNPKLFTEVDSSLIDTEVGYIICSFRSNDEIDKFYATGVMPAHVKKQAKPKYVAKSEYSQTTFVDPQEDTQVVDIIEEAEDDDLFFDPFAKKA